MMAFSPLFLVTDIKEPTREGLNRDERKDLWKTSFDFGAFHGNSVDFFFPTEQKATEFAPGQTYRPSDMLEILRSDQPYVARQVVRRSVQGTMNTYTGKALPEDSWNVFLAEDLNGVAIEWHFNNEPSARRYTEGQAYYLQDMIGTMPSDPISVNTDRLSDEIKSAYAAKVEAKRLEDEAAQAALEIALAERLAKDLAEAERKARLQRAKAKAEAAKKAAAAAKAKAQKAAAAKKAAQQKAAEESKAPKTVKVKAEDPKWGEGSKVYWTITNGGASGRYNGVFYKAGSFVPKNGQWLGTFVASTW